jgi:hypothetical protein
MASKQTGQSLRQVARALEKVPDDAVRDAAEKVVDEARFRGGSFYAGRTRLGARVKNNAKGVTVLGTPPGAWAIKSFGRVTSVARPGGVLGRKGGTFHATRSRGTRGDLRWERVVERAEDEAPRIIGKAVSKAVSA